MENLPGNRSAFAAARKRMVRQQLAGLSPRVLAAMAQVPRHAFVPAAKQSLAYADCPLPIGFDQTISQPYIVALMTTQLDPQPTDHVLEIGTGSGYQTAVLAELVAEVFTIEIIGPLAQRAATVLRQLAGPNIHLRTGDGFAGWPEAAPFDAIIATCAPQHVPPPLIEQLKDGGKLIIPLGPMGNQKLVIFQKLGHQLTEQTVFPVRFVPMTGTAAALA